MTMGDLSSVWDFFFAVPTECLLDTIWHDVLYLGGGILLGVLAVKRGGPKIR